MEDVPYVYGNPKIDRYVFNSHWLNIKEEVGYWKLVICTKNGSQALPRTGH